MSKFLLLSLILTAFILPANFASAQGENSPVVSIIEAPSVERSWSDMDLLYDGQWHDSEEVQEEINRIHDLFRSIQGQSIPSYASYFICFFGLILMLPSVASMIVVVGFPGYYVVSKIEKELL
ncbi:MAG: hypothetical protein ACW99U_06230 [Candidatus Thorarchaeota archaeon]|jgi:hypothetical protein